MRLTASQKSEKLFWNIPKNVLNSSDNKKILLTARHVRLDSGHYATKYHNGTSLEFPARNSEKNFIMSHEAEVLIKFNDDL